MHTALRETWETYTTSWQAESTSEKQALFERCLNPQCRYQDPLASTGGWEELQAYMLEFHRQIPGGHFKTTQFFSHNQQSIARWDMFDGAGKQCGEGISYAHYDERGRLLSIHGFYETP